MKRADEIEQQRLQEVADEYKKRGYRVWIRPNSTELPGNLRAFQLDLMATSENDFVVVEVRSRESLANDRRLAEVAEAVKHMSGWRFELVVTNPVSGPAPRVGVSLNDDQISEQIEEVRALVAAKFIKPAYMSAWAVAEAVLRETAYRLNIELPGIAPVAVLKTLRSQGVLSKQSYEKLDIALRIRSAVAHGFFPMEDPSPHLASILEVIDELRAYKPADA